MGKRSHVIVATLVLLSVATCGGPLTARQQLTTGESVQESRSSSVTLTATSDSSETESEAAVELASEGSFEFDYSVSVGGSGPSTFNTLFVDAEILSDTALVSVAVSDWWADSVAANETGPASPMFFPALCEIPSVGIEPNCTNPCDFLEGGECGPPPVPCIDAECPLPPIPCLDEPCPDECSLPGADVLPTCGGDPCQLFPDGDCSPPNECDIPGTDLLPTCGGDPCQLFPDGDCSPPEPCDIHDVPGLCSEIPEPCTLPFLEDVPPCSPFPNECDTPLGAFLEDCGGELPNPCFGVIADLVPQCGGDPDGFVFGLVCQDAGTLPGVDGECQVSPSELQPFVNTTCSLAQTAPGVGPACSFAPNEVLDAVCTVADADESGNCGPPTDECYYLSEVPVLCPVTICSGGIGVQPHCVPPCNDGELGYGDACFTLPICVPAQPEDICVPPDPDTLIPALCQTPSLGVEPTCLPPCEPGEVGWSDACVELPICIPGQPDDICVPPDGTLVERCEDPATGVEPACLPPCEPGQVGYGEACVDEALCVPTQPDEICAPTLTEILSMVCDDDSLGVEPDCVPACEPGALGYGDACVSKCPPGSFGVVVNGEPTCEVPPLCESPDIGVDDAACLTVCTSGWGFELNGDGVCLQTCPGGMGFEAAACIVPCPAPGLGVMMDEVPGCVTPCAGNQIGVVAADVSVCNYVCPPGEVGVGFAACIDFDSGCVSNQNVVILANATGEVDESDRPPVLCVETVLTCASPMVGADAQTAQENASNAAQSCVDSVAGCMGGLALWALAPDDWLTVSPDVEGAADDCATALQECVPTEDQVNDRNVTRLVGCVMPYTPCAESPLLADFNNDTSDNIVCPREPEEPGTSPAGVGPPPLADPAFLVGPGGLGCYTSQLAAYYQAVLGTHLEGDADAGFSPGAPDPGRGSCWADPFNVTLGWTDAEASEERFYTVYLDTSSPPQQPECEGVNDTKCPVRHDLLLGHTYYWQVGLVDGLTVTRGPVWTFSTDVCNEENWCPDAFTQSLLLSSTFSGAQQSLPEEPTTPPALVPMDLASEEDPSFAAWNALNEGESTQCVVGPTNRACTVILLHGVAMGIGHPTDVGGPMDNGMGGWNDLASLLTDRGYNVVKLGYYGADCDVTASAADYGNHDGPFASGHTWAGTTVTGCNGNQLAHSLNADIRHLALHVAEYIYQTYSDEGVYVDVVAHSMGGLVLRSALQAVNEEFPDFPPELLIDDVITAGTPHLGTRWACLSWLTRDLFPYDAKQPEQMCASRFNGLLNWINDNTAPQYQGGVDWSYVGSTGHELFGLWVGAQNGDGIVPEWSSTGMPGLGHQYLYRNPAYFHFPREPHDAYYQDRGLAQDAHVEWGHGAEGDGRAYETATGFRFGMLADLAIRRPDR